MDGDGAVDCGRGSPHLEIKFGVRQRVELNH